MARVAIVFGLLLCGLTFAALVGTMEKSPSLFFPMILGIPILFCGVVGLNPHRRRHALYVACSIATLGALAGLGRLGVLMSRLSRQQDVNGYTSNLMLVMTAVCLVYALVCISSLILMRRRRMEAERAARGSINLHQPSGGNDSLTDARSRESA